MKSQRHPRTRCPWVHAGVEHSGGRSGAWSRSSSHPSTTAASSSTTSRRLGLHSPSTPSSAAPPTMDPPAAPDRRATPWKLPLPRDLTLSVLSPRDGVSGSPSIGPPPGRREYAYFDGPGEDLLLAVGIANNRTPCKA